MSTMADFESAPVGATATHETTGNRATKMNDSERGWSVRIGPYWSGEMIWLRGYTLDVPARSLPTREEIADELSGWPIGSGYYQTRVAMDEARDMADAVLDLLKGQDR